jgi:methanethiol S-methyltransferase
MMQAIVLIISRRSAMQRVAFLLYGLLAYVSFLAVFLYAIGFLGNFWVPKSIDSGVEGPLAASLAVNVALLVLFGLQHTIMARQGFKAWWTKLVPRPVERSTYVIISNVLLALLYWQWRPITGVVWSVESAIGGYALWTLFGAGWLLVFLSSLVIDHFDLFGLRQVVLYYQGKQYEPLHFKAAWFYKLVRHPLLLGWMIAFWATPEMSVGHLLFAIGTTLYMLIAIPIEERDLAQFHGPEYADYRRRVPMLLPFLKK